MAWLACDKDGSEVVFRSKPFRREDYWDNGCEDYCNMPRGSIKKLIGRQLKWEDNPVELEEDE